MSRDSDALILQLYARTPAPCRDYCGLSVKKDEIVLNVWNITYGPHVYPKRNKRSLEDFLHDRQFQTEVHRLFGQHVLSYVTSIARNEKTLLNLPEKVFLRILKYLAMKDILNLSQTSKIMFELCNTENIWKILFSKRFKKRPVLQDAIVAERFGWKDALRQKIDIKKIKNTKKSKPPAASSKNSINQKQIQFKPNVNTINNNKQLQKSVRINNNVVDKKLPHNVNLVDQGKERHNKIQNKNIGNITGIENNGPILIKHNKNNINIAKSSPMLTLPKTGIFHKTGHNASGVKKNEPTVKITDKSINTAKSSSIMVAPEKPHQTTNIKSSSSFLLQKPPIFHQTTTVPRIKDANEHIFINNTNNRINTAKSSSILVAPKTPIFHQTTTNTNELEKHANTVIKYKNKINTTKSSSILIAPNTPIVHNNTITTVCGHILVKNTNKGIGTAKSSSILEDPRTHLSHKTTAKIKLVDKSGQTLAKIPNSINNAKSSSILVTPRTAILNNLKINYTKSVGNINNPLKKVLQKSKNCLNLNTKQSNIIELKIDIPKKLEHSRPKTPNVSKTNTGAPKSKMSFMKK